MYHSNKDFSSESPAVDLNLEQKPFGVYQQKGPMFGLAVQIWEFGL